MNTDPVAVINTWAPVMVHSLWRASWQGSVAIAVMWGACRALPALPPRVRCWLWRLAYLKLLAALLWATPVALPLLPAPPAPVVSRRASVPMDTPERESTRRSESAGREGAVAPDTTPSPQSRPFAPRLAPTLFSPDPTARTRIHSAPMALLPRNGPNLAGWLLLLWMAGASLMAVRVGCDWHASRGLAGGAVLAADPWLLESCAALGRRFGLRRCPRVLLSDAAGSPVLVGACRPALILPPSLLAGCDCGELQAILAHELAHLKRGDLLWAWLPTLAQALFFFHPLVWLAQREWRLAQEICCDELAVLVTPVSALEYGQVVLKVAARRRPDRCREPLAVGVVGSYQSLRRRLVALQQLRPMSRRRWRDIGALLAAAGTMLIVPWHVTAQAALAPLPWPGFYSRDTPGERYGRDLFMLNRPEALKELKVSNQQRDQIQAALTVLRQRARALGPFWNLSPAPRAVALAKNRSMLRQAHRQAAGILTANQRTRLRQIELQQDTALSLQDEDVARELRLRPAQRRQVQTILEQHWQAVRSLPNPSRQLPGARRQRAVAPDLFRNFGQIHRRTQRRLLAVLTAEQRSQYFTMLGRPYPPLADTFLLRLRQRALGEVGVPG